MCLWRGADFLSKASLELLCFGKKIGAAQKNTLNLSFNINPWLAHCMGASGRLAPLPSCTSCIAYQIPQQIEQ